MKYMLIIYGNQELWSSIDPAEMAKEITCNLEKWLPEGPDRERWSQEEPLTDAMKEAPLAELPRTLQDQVGNLMEEEKDLFDEMEDVSTSWADACASVTPGFSRPSVIQLP